jgi:threonine dehydrogenase-like Zn-dependent dehydrogenase
VILPFDSSLPPDIAAPELRAAIASGAYGADIIELIPGLLRDGDRVLVVGDGFGLISTLIAKSPAAPTVIVAEPDAMLLEYLKSVHARNGVPGVESMDVFPAVGLRGRVPYFVRRDPRQSSLRPDDGPWLRVSMTPLIDLNLLLSEARISLVLWCCAPSAASMLAEADLDTVDRILLAAGDETGPCDEETTVAGLLRGRGFRCTEPRGTVLLKRAA